MRSARLGHSFLKVPGAFPVVLGVSVAIQGRFAFLEYQLGVAMIVRLLRQMTFLVTQDTTSVHVGNRTDTWRPCFALFIEMPIQPQGAKMTYATSRCFAIC